MKNKVDSKLCLLCRGAKLLCGLAYCPIIVKNIYYIKSIKFSNLKSFEGSSPPSIFVGRVGYPYVYVGPMVPPYIGDTSILDFPELWVDKSIEDIIDFRSTLIRGKTLVNVKELNKYSKGKVVRGLQELAIAEKPVDSEIQLSKPVKVSIRFDEHTPPLGPSGILQEFKVISNIVANKKLEKVYYDTDLKAIDAIKYLYINNVPVSQIQRALSIGVLGVSKKRKLVPTRWAITAVDDVASKLLIEKIRNFPVVNRYYVYYREVFKNLFVAIIAPKPWSYEWIEAWFPKTTWNPNGDEIEIGGDYEGFKGRTTYAEPGGCYYAARLATTEFLYKIGRQGTAVVLREIYTGFNLPIGVWFVRENLREMFKGTPQVYDSIKDVLNFLKNIMKVNLITWIKESKLLKDLIYQESLNKYFKGLHK